ncbi:nurim-like [Mytilus edulis]|uniref:nurim-like n=1 Tax=Mytilus edulis TaxID=6550 RepID=UPI0039F12122
MLQTTMFLLFGIFSFTLLAGTTFKLVRFLSTQPDQEYVIKDSSNLIMIVVDFCLLLLFMVQHSVMTSKSIKKELWPLCKPLYRTLYTISTCLALQTLMYFWQRTDISLWLINTEDAPLTSLFFTLVQIFCWMILFLENTLTEPFFLIGIKQLYNHIQGYRSPKRFFSRQFQELLSHMPHPGTTCFILILWMFPIMTLDRWLLATVLTMYMCKSYSVTHQDYLYTEQQIQTAEYVTMSTSTTITE